MLLLYILCVTWYAHLMMIPSIAFFSWISHSLPDEARALRSSSSIFFAPCSGHKLSVEIFRVLAIRKEYSTKTKHLIKSNQNKLQRILFLILALKIQKIIDPM